MDRAVSKENGERTNDWEGEEEWRRRESARDDESIAVAHTIWMLIDVNWD